MKQNSKSETRKWYIVNDQRNENYDAGNEIIYNTKILKSNLCGYNDAYILVISLKVVQHSLSVAQKLIKQQ